MDDPEHELRAWVMSAYWQVSLPSRARTRLARLTYCSIPRSYHTRVQICVLLEAVARIY